jgi:hypothetical protein
VHLKNTKYSGFQAFLSILNTIAKILCQVDLRKKYKKVGENQDENHQKKRR